MDVRVVEGQGVKIDSDVGNIMACGPAIQWCLSSTQLIAMQPSLSTP